MSETRNIVILGTSFGGLGAAHYIARHVLPKLAQAKDVKYNLHLVDPSTHFWWNIGAPRELVCVPEMPHSKYFLPTSKAFEQYPKLKDSIIFHHGTATGVDLEGRSVTFTPHGSESTETLPYYALVIATGVRSPTPITTLHGDHNISIRALEEMNTKLAAAKEIVIGGGGPVAVEAAGEIGVHLKGAARITLVAGGSKLLPALTAPRATQAQKLLEKAGVTVLYDTSVTSSNDTPEGKTEVQLSNGKNMIVDVYIPAVGVKPNTSFLPKSILKENSGWVNANPTTLRVDSAGPRVYAVGDVANADKGGALAMQASLPIFGRNFAHDILKEAGVGTAPPEATYKRNDSETQVVPIGPKSGVGAFNGWKLPGFAVSMIKGKDYMANQINKTYLGTGLAKA